MVAENTNLTLISGKMLNSEGNYEYCKIMTSFFDIHPPLIYANKLHKGTDKILGFHPTKGRVKKKIV